MFTEQSGGLALPVVAVTTIGSRGELHWEVMKVIKVIKAARALIFRGEPRVSEDTRTQ